MTHNVFDLLCLSSVPRIGPLKLRALIAHFKDPSDVLRASPRELAKVPGIDRKLASAIAHHRTGKAFAREQLQRLNRAGARIVTLWDHEYPDLLRKIYDPPAILYVRGQLDPSDRYAVAVVGTRTPSAYGQRVTQLFCTELIRQGICVVSGLARGIDTIAHGATLKGNGRTIAVIGSGLDIPYPPENRGLLEAVTTHGAVISEFPMGTKPDAPNFPRRNRIISGLALATIVMESAEDGGAMITASTALDQNREVFAVPGSVLEKRSAGPHKLIREGRAMLAGSVEDILGELRVQLKPVLKETRPPEPPLELTLFERRILDALGETPVHIDDISEATGLSTADALVTLLALEFKNLVRQRPGKFFEKAGG